MTSFALAGVNGLAVPLPPDKMDSRMQARRCAGSIEDDIGNNRTRQDMDGKIALEEHFAIQDTLQDSAGFLPPHTWEELSARLLDIHDRRLREMDAHGVEIMILSLNAPAVQAIHDRDAAIATAKKANDILAEEVAKRPDRFRACAALPMQDPDAAARELERCVREFGFVGALVNGFSQIDEPDTAVYYDLPQYGPFWSTLADLDVPFYLHPRNPLPSQAKIYEGHPWLMGPAWAFGQETAVHALRLMASGMFDKHPNIQIVLGHMGEGLPYSIWRVDNHNAWTETPAAYPAARQLGEYFQENFYITTSGNFRTQTLIDAMLEIGSDRILFSADWPFENVDHAAIWFDAATISEADRLKIGRTNSAQLFRIER
jgi:2,3-dihydroxybenzoate decarboxylase